MFHTADKINEVSFNIFFVSVQSVYSAAWLQFETDTKKKVKLSFVTWVVIVCLEHSFNISSLFAQ